MLSPIPQRPLYACIAVLLLGYATGLQLGRIAPYALRLSDTYGFSLSTIGWLTSLVTFFVAILAIPASRIIPPFGHVCAIKLGVVIMTAGAVLFVFSDTLLLMVGARIVEAAGHIITVIAAPAYLASQAPAKLRRIFLALWSSFLPVGFAMSNGLGSQLPDTMTLGSIWLIYASVLVVATVFVFLFMSDTPTHETPAPTPDTSGRSKIAWILVFAFGTYAFLSIGFFSFLPTYVPTSGPKVFSTSVVPLFVPLGSFIAAFLFARTRAAFPPRVIGIGFLLISIAALFCFSDIIEDGSLARAVYAFACGITAASIFTSVPAITRTSQEATLTIGAIAQAGGLMVLVGAPLSGFLLEWGDWHHLGYALSGSAFLAVVMTALVLGKTNSC